jgi:hypothetical protein
VGTGIGFVVAGVVMSFLALALLTNYRRLGHKAATFGGSLTFMIGGGDALRRPRRASAIWGLVLLIIGIAWIVGGLVLASR